MTASLPESRTTATAPDVSGVAPTSASGLAADVASFDGVTFRWQPGKKSKGTPQPPVLDGFSLSIRRGEHLGLLGPNGSGKSTALSLLAGLHLPESGSVTWRLAGTDVSPTSPRARSAFSVVFQSPSLDGQLTARDNLSLAAQMRGLDKASTPAIPAIIDELLAAFDLSARADDRVKTFSGGMKRRLDLARALIGRPTTLLLDEPTSGLDEHAFRAFWAALAKRRDADRLTIVTATHRPDEAALCDRLALVHRGRIVAEGSPANLIKQLGEDLILVRAERADEVAGIIAAKLGLVTRTAVGDGHLGDVTCEVPTGEDGARLLVRVVELFPKERLDTIALKRPTLADVFAKLTGATLASDLPEAA